MKLRDIAAALIFWPVVGCGMLSGCALKTDGLDVSMPGETLAMDIVWSGKYGRTEEAPRVNYVQGADLTCTQSDSGRPGFYAVVGWGAKCVGGVTYFPNEIWVAWPSDQTFCMSTFAHELLHAAQAYDGIVDPNHTREDWTTVLPGAVDLLVQSGLCN